MKKILTCAALSVILLSGCNSIANNGAAVKVNGTVITKGQIEKIVDRDIDNSFLKSFGGAANIDKKANNTTYMLFKQKATNQLIVQTLIEQEIAKRGIVATEDDIKAEMKTIIDRVGSEDELYSTLKKSGVSKDEFKKDLETQIKVKKLAESIEKVNITDKDAKKYYDTHKDKFTHGERVRASHILISCDVLQTIKDIKAKNKDISSEELNKQIEELNAKQKAKAEAILKEVKANPDKFEEIASKNSDDPGTADRGGELGFFTADQMVPEFAKAAFAMKPDTISDTPVKSVYGYHIIKVTDRAEGGVEPFAKVQDEIKFYLETEQQLKVLKRLTEGLQKNAKIEYVDKSYDPQNMFKKEDKKVEETKEK